MIEVIWGTSEEKPLASRALADAIANLDLGAGYLYLGYPVISSPTGPMKLDALLISTKLGLVAFDLVESMGTEGWQSRQDEIASMLEVRLKPHAALRSGRRLRFDINVVTYAPAKIIVPPSENDYHIANDEEGLDRTLQNFHWEDDEAIYQALVAAVQVVTSIRAGKQKREPKNPDSRGARLKRVEDSIANLDQRQSQAVIETVEGVQRIRGLAGSGKTIVLALKVAYLHSQNPGWRIAVTFNTRSLKEQFRRLINSFTLEQSGSEPDWDVIDIVNAWGGPGSPDRDGLYHKFCRANAVQYYDYGAAKTKFGEKLAFEGACAEAMAAATSPAQLYDLILIDEAQDLPVHFLRMCYQSLSEPKRLVYAYDELQTLTSASISTPEDLFGKRADGEPLVRLNYEEGGPRQDIILEKCYRNSRPLLAAAHALGFGIYRESGLVQMFDTDSLWTDVGYDVVEGELRPGAKVALARTAETSPLFLENHSAPEDLIQFHRFDSKASQAEWLVENIKRNIRQEELRPEDIVVINPEPLSTQREMAPIRTKLFSDGVNSELAGVSTSADVFVKTGSVTFTGIFRAKGNEAGMVYIINAQDCASGWDKTATAIARNRLFTAITRSKAWVRILGVGPAMDRLTAEFEDLRGNDYQLRFTYPTEEEKKELRVINVETPGRARRRKERERQRDLVLEAASKGEVDIDQLIAELSALGKRRKK
ncbi:MAG: ATP-binding domain-containing protein [Pseudorhodoferax sp.]